MVHRSLESRAWKSPKGHCCVVRQLLLVLVLSVGARQHAEGMRKILTEAEELELEAFDVDRDLQEVDVGGIVPDRLNGKKGACFTLRESGQPGSWKENLPKVRKLDAGWNYSWGQSRPDAQSDSIDFLPMIWGYWNDPNELRRKLDDIKSQDPKMLLGFNEPDKGDQADMTVETALRAWPILESANIPLVSPSCAYPRGDWMETFMDRSVELDLRIDVIGVHYYGGPNARAFRGLLRSIYAEYGRPILVTEFAVADWSAKTTAQNRYSPQQVLDFMKSVLPWMEDRDWILGYAWFSFNTDTPEGTSSALIHPRGNTTVLGEYYAQWN